MCVRFVCSTERKREKERGNSLVSSLLAAGRRDRDSKKSAVKLTDRRNPESQIESYALPREFMKTSRFTIPMLKRREIAMVRP